MSKPLQHLIDNNRLWAERVEQQHPGFFKELSAQQSPKYLWIGCSDSRVPANQVIGLAPGEVFVHRNVANVVAHSDLNALSVIQFAVDVLKVEHIMVVGHYGCGGVLAALEELRVGLADNWIRHVKDVRVKHYHLIKNTAVQHRHDVLCELNVIEQVMNVAQSTVMQDAWARGQKVTLHGWCYSLKNGLITNLEITLPGVGGLYDVHERAVELVATRERS